MKLSEIRGSAENLVETNEQNKKQSQELNYALNSVNIRLQNIQNSLMAARQKLQQARSAANNSQHDDNSSQAQSELIGRLEQQVENLRQREIAETNYAISLHSKIKALSDEQERVKDSLLETVKELKITESGYHDNLLLVSELHGYSHSHNVNELMAVMRKNLQAAMALRNKIYRSLGMSEEAYQDFDSEPAGAVKTLGVKSLFKHSFGGRSSVFGEESNAYSYGITPQADDEANTIGITKATSGGFGSLMEYMCAHNYKKEDFEIYSQDPVWRELQKKEFPDYVLPPQERTLNDSIYNKLSKENALSLTQEERKSLENYSGSGEINKTLYDKSFNPGSTFVKEGIEKDIYNITNSIEKCEIPYDTEVYRGIGDLNIIFGNDVKTLSIEELNDKYRGRIFINKGFSSTSTLYSVAEKFAGGFNGGILSIDVNKGSNGIVMGDVSIFNNEEREVLLQRGSIFKIDSVKLDENKCIVVNTTLIGHI